MMAMDVLGAGVLGVVAILVWGGLLGLGTGLLPLLFKDGDGGQEPGWDLGPAAALEPGAAPAPAAQERSAPVLPPREPLAARMGGAGEESLVAAAIALALSLYQAEARPVLAAETAPRVGSPWALSGRWQAMQARLNRQQKR